MMKSQVRGGAQKARLRLLGLSCAPMALAGPTYTQTGAHHSLSATASNGYSETLKRTGLGLTSLLLLDREPNVYEADARLVAFFNLDSIELITFGESSTRGDSDVSCTTSSTASATFSVPVASTVTVVATGGGGSGWSAVFRDGGSAAYSFSLTGASGVVLSRSAPTTPENFELSATLPAGEYTVIATNSTSSSADGDETTSSLGICGGGIEIEITPGGAGCNAADFSVPLGTLNIADVIGFLQSFGVMDASADLALPNGVWDIGDVVAFLQVFGAGCP